MATINSPPSTSAMRSRTSITNSLLPDTSDLRKTALGFLDLPPEIRFQIYGYLLLTVQSVSLASRTPYSRLAPILIIEHRDERPGGIKPSNVAVPWLSCQPVPFRTYSAILSTCKAVHSEATSLVYEKNVFRFDVPDDAEDESALASSLSEQCNNIFEYKDKDWREEGPLLLKDSTFACFLNRIGARNAASLKAVQFHAKDANVGRYQFSVIGKLLERHVPNVSFIRVNIRVMRYYATKPPSTMSWEGANGASSAFSAFTDFTKVDAEEELKRLCHVVTELVRGCPSLEEIDYRGNGFPKVLILCNGSRKVVGSQDKSQYLYLREAMRMVKERKERKDDHLRMAQE